MNFKPPDWESLSEIVARLKDLGIDPAVSSPRLVRGIAERRITVRAHVAERSDYGGRVFVSGERVRVEPPARLHIEDFDWLASRPKTSWLCGSGRIFDEMLLCSIELIELRTRDVLNLLVQPTSTTTPPLRENDVEAGEQQKQTARPPEGANSRGPAIRKALADLGGIEVLPTNKQKRDKMINDKLRLNGEPVADPKTIRGHLKGK